MMITLGTNSVPDLASSEYSFPNDDKALTVRVVKAAKANFVEFENKTTINDIAVLMVEREIEYNDFISPICLPFHDESNVDKSQVNQSDCYTAGWGSIGHSIFDKIFYYLKPILMHFNMKM